MRSGWRHEGIGQREREYGRRVMEGKKREREKGRRHSREERVREKKGRERR